MPNAAPNIEVIKDAVRLACRAPSLHNSQPWRWVLDGGRLELFVDRRRVMFSADRRGREAIISCGAVLDHLRVATAAVGWTTDVVRFPDPEDGDHLASVGFTPMDFVADIHRRRADAILLRRTDRLPLAMPPDWESLERALHTVVDDGIAHLDVIDEALRPELADASRLTDALRLYDGYYHTELSWWTAPFETTEGIPHSSLVSASESERVDVGRAFPVAAHSDRRPGIYEDQSKILVLSTDGDTREDALRCGEMLSRLLLDATSAGMATCAVTHVTELAASRHIIGTLIARTAWPQALIRVGVAPILEGFPPSTPRRPLDDVLKVRYFAQHDC